jgi:hypothetical protein
MRALDLSGHRFGKLTVVGLGDATPSKHRRWVCACDCGGTSYPTTGSLRSGKTKSCGCGIGVSARSRFTTHGLTQTPEYGIWCNMLARTGEPSNKSYPDYGGRGISACPDWASSFQAFYDYMGPRPSPRHTLDRINNDGNYEPGNCRWATYEVQASNRRSTKRIAHDGRSMTVREWSDETGLQPGTINMRLSRGWATSEALQFPASRGRAA